MKRKSSLHCVLCMQTAELLERRKEVLEKKINVELLKAKELLKVGNKTGMVTYFLVNNIYMN